MPLNAIYANLACSDLARSRDWYGMLFDRDPDASPMEGLLEWHHERKAGFQLFEQPDRAGHGTATLIVSDLTEERERLARSGIDIAEIEQGDAVRILRLSDPDDNLVVLAEPA